MTMRLRNTYFAVAVAGSLASSASAQNGVPRMTGPDVCVGRLWIKHMANIQSKSDFSDDPTSCYFELIALLGVASCEPATKLVDRLNTAVG
jgi:hypothetical protein